MKVKLAALAVGTVLALTALSASARPNTYADRPNTYAGWWGSFLSWIAS